MKKLFLLFVMLLGLGISTASAQTDTHKAAVNAFCSLMDRAAVNASKAKTLDEFSASIENVGENMTQDESLALMAGISDKLTTADKTRIKESLNKLMLVGTKMAMAEEGGAATAQEAAMMEAMIPAAVNALVAPIVDNSNTLADVFANLSKLAM